MDTLWFVLLIAQFVIGGCLALTVDHAFFIYALAMLWAAFRVWQWQHDRAR